MFVTVGLNPIDGDGVIEGDCINSVSVIVGDIVIVNDGVSKLGKVCVIVIVGVDDGVSGVIVIVGDGVAKNSLGVGVTVPGVSVTLLVGTIEGVGVTVPGDADVVGVVSTTV